MAAPDRAFNEVKSILRKLDRDIQSARDRRLGRDPVPGEDTGISARGRELGAGLPSNNPANEPNSDRAIDQSRGSATPGRDANDGGRHGFGRARPKPRPSTND